LLVVVLRVAEVFLLALGPGLFFAVDLLLTFAGNDGRGLTVDIAVLCRS
jgi:hypothetical protein